MKYDIILIGMANKPEDFLHVLGEPPVIMTEEK